MSSDLDFIKEEQKLTAEKILQKVSFCAEVLLSVDNILEYMCFHKESCWLTQEKIYELEHLYNTLMSQVNEYKSLGEFAVVTYKILQQIHSINPLYYISMRSFQRIFRDTLHESQATRAASSCITARMDEIKYLFMENLYQRLSIALNKDDLIFFPLLVLLEEARIDELVSKEEMSLFILSFNAMDKVVHTFNTFRRPEWLTEESWKRFCLLDEYITCFDGLIRGIVDNLDEWKDFFKLKPMLVSPPSIELLHINKFQLALLWLAYDTSMILCICKELILCKLGPKFITTPLFDIDYAYKLTESRVFNMIVLPSNDKPIIIDPIVVISRLASEENITSFTNLCMGDNVDSIIEAVETTAALNGWIAIENCHILKNWTTSFITKLKTILDGQAQLKVSTFRIWLILRDSRQLTIPYSILQQSVSIRWQIPVETMQSIISRCYQGLGDSQPSSDHVISLLRHGVMKNRNYAYSAQYPISSCEIDRLITEKEKINLHEWKLSRLKENVFSSRIMNDADKKLLNSTEITGSAEIIGSTEMNADVGLETSSTVRSDHIFKTLQDIYSIFPPKVDSMETNDVKQLIQTLINIKDDHESHMTLNVKDKNRMISYIFHEVQHVKERLQLFINELNILKDILQNNVPSSQIYMNMWKDISCDKIPSHWTEINMNKSTTFSNNIRFLTDKLTYLKSLLDRSSTNVYDLHYFDDVSSFLHAVKLHLLQNNKQKNVKYYYHAKPLKNNVEPSNSNLLRNEVYFKNFKFYLGNKMYENIPYVSFALHTKEVDKEFALDVYECYGNRNQTLFQLDCEPLLSKEEMEKYLYVFTK